MGIIPSVHQSRRLQSFGNSAYHVNSIWHEEVAPMQVDTVEQNQRRLRSGLHGNGADRDPHATLSPNATSGLGITHACEIFCTTCSGQIMKEGPSIQPLRSVARSCSRRGFPSAPRKARPRTAEKLALVGTYFIGEYAAYPG